METQVEQGALATTDELFNRIVEPFDRTLVLEMLRYVLRLRARQLGSVAALARDAGIAPQTLRGLLEGGEPHERTFGRLAAYTRAHGPWPMVPPGMVGLALVVETLPKAARGRARVALGEMLAGFLSANGEDAPHWLAEERERP